VHGKDKLIKKAEYWAGLLWRDAQSRWSERSGQDKNYRQHVIHPAVCSLLRESFPDRGVRILELGCGDGFFLDDLKEHKLIENGGAYLGVDISAELIKRARKNNTGEHIDFLQSNLADNKLAEYIWSRNESWDCVVSIFVIQEIPDIKSVMANLGKILPNGLPVIFVTVHPDFAQWLLQKGRMQKADEYDVIPLNEGNEQGEIQWHWAGYYPIVDEPLDAFHLPYFHRNLDDYRSFLNKSGFVIDNIIELPEAQNDLPLLVKQGISPFAPFETNLYWPLIGEAPSSIVIIAHRERENEQE